MLIFPDLPDFSCEKQEIQGKVQAEKKHVDGYDDLYGGAVACDAVVGDGEAARTGGGKTDGHALVQSHAGNLETNDLKGDQTEVHSVQDLVGLTQPGDQLAGGGTGHFRPHHVHRTGFTVGNDGRDKYKDAHASDDVSGASPEENASWQRFDLGKNGRTGGGESGNRLKETGNVVSEAAVDEEGEGAESTQYQPDEGNGNVAFPRIEGSLLRRDQAERNACHDKNSDGDEERYGRLSVQQRDCRHQHQHGSF